MGWRPMKERGQIKYHQSKQKTGFQQKKSRKICEGQPLHRKVNINKIKVYMILTILSLMNMSLLKHKPAHNEASQI